MISDNYITGVKVIESIDPEDGERHTRVVTQLYKHDDEDGRTYVDVVDADSDAARVYALDDGGDVTVDDATGTITFPAYDRIYTIRGFQDSDGLWASALRVEVPAEALEETYMAATDPDFNPAQLGEGEVLFAGTDPESGEAAALLYSFTGGFYSRIDGQWVKVQDGDESLDGLDVTNVDSKFVSVWDISQADGETLMLEDVEKYASDSEE